MAAPDVDALDDSLNAAMLADPDGGPWEYVLASALDVYLSMERDDEDYGVTGLLVQSILEEYRAAMQRRTEEGGV